MSRERRINLRFSPERFDKIDEKRFRERKSFQQIGSILFETWLAGEHEQAMHYLRRPADPLIERLAMLQASGDEAYLALVRKAIDAAYAVMRNSLTAEEMEQLKAVAYGEAKPQVEPRDETHVVPPRRGRPRKTA
jgi:hypothetical protein